MKRFLLFAFAHLFFVPNGFTQTTVDIISSRDNTMYSENSGNSNGAGEFMFTGNNDNSEARRALLYFDIASTIPAGSTINSVTLTLYMSRTQAGAESVALHKLTKDWGEAGSNAPGQEGKGTAAMTNDATWSHNFFNVSTWTNPGASGDYVNTASASTMVSGNGFYTWSSTQLSADVQNMLDNSTSNFGWIIIGNENQGKTAKRFNTHENSNATQRPKLTITYTPPPSPQLLVINEIDYDQPGSDMAEFIELRNNDSTGIDLSNYEIELVNGSTGAVYRTIALPSVTLAPGDYFVICGGAGSVPNCDMAAGPASNMIQNGAPDAVAIKFNGTTIIDAVSYEGNTVAPYTEGSGVGLEDISTTPDMGISRIPDGHDSNVNNQDFVYTCITPGLRNGGPQITFNLSGSNNGFCPGDSILLIASGDNNNPQWYRNGSPIPGAIDTFYYAKTAGTYNMMADHGSCRDSAAAGVQIQEFSAPIVDLGPDTSVCQNYLLDAGNPGASYQWSTGATTRIIQVIQSGTYSVTVTNSDGCSASDMANIIIGTPFSIALEDPITACDSAILDAAGPAGATYLWNTGATSQSIIAHSSGIYWVDVYKDGCHASDTSHVTITPTPTVSLGPDRSTCDSVVLTAETGAAGPYSYLWNTGDTSMTIVVHGPFALNGMYSVTVTDNGCSASDTVIVTQLPLPTVDLGADFQACNAATLDAGNPGSTYLWSTGQSTQSIVVTTTGTYWVQVTNASGCVASDTVHVTINPSLEVNLGDTVIACDSTILDPGIPGGIYLWNTGANTSSIVVHNSGLYSVTVTQNGCSGSDSVLVFISPSPHVNLGADIAACDSAQLDAGQHPNAQYLWSTGESSSNIIVKKSGTYSVTVTENGCSASDTVHVEVTPTPFLELGDDITACGGPVTLIGESDAKNYHWSTGDTGMSTEVYQSGIYWLEASNNGCTTRDSIKVTILPLPVFSLGPDFSACDVATLTAPVNGTYHWSTGENSASIHVTATGNYALTVTDPNGCSYADTVHVTIHQSPTMELGPDVEACESYEIHVNANGSYHWNTGDTSASIVVTHSGFYSVTVTDSNACSASDSIHVTIHPNPVVDLGPDTSVCEGYLLDAGHFAAYEWNTGDSTQSIAIDESGMYAVTVIDSNGCRASDSVHIDIIPKPKAKFDFDDSTACPTVFFFDNSEGPIDQWQWSFADDSFSTEQNPQHTYLKNGIYNVKLTVSNVCGSDEKVEEIEVDCISIGIEKISNAFRVYPNPADGRFFLELQDPALMNAKFRISEISGRVVQAGSIRELRTLLDLSGESAGIYILSIQTSSKSYLVKMVISK